MALRGADASLIGIVGCLCFITVCKAIGHKHTVSASGYSIVANYYKESTTFCRPRSSIATWNDSIMQIVYAIRQFADPEYTAKLECEISMGFLGLVTAGQNISVAAALTDIEHCTGEGFIAVGHHLTKDDFTFHLFDVESFPHLR